MAVGWKGYAHPEYGVHTHHIYYTLSKDTTKTNKKTEGIWLLGEKGMNIQNMSWGKLEEHVYSNQE